MSFKDWTMIRAKCRYCGGKGLFPFCEVCFKSSDSAIDHRTQVTEQKAKAALKSKNRNDAHWEAIEQHKYLQNKKDLKAMLAGALRSRKLLTGVPGADAIINEIVSEAIGTVHYEIDCRQLTTFADVINRFDALIAPPRKENKC